MIVSQVKETVDWVENNQELELTFEQLQSYLNVGHPGSVLMHIFDFCDQEIYDGISLAKKIFEDFQKEEIHRARRMANLFESINSVFFMNRAAVKLANIDAVTDFMFTKINEDVYHCDSKGPFYFADVCGGPGGFTEYILWRKSWMFKGFGFTLKNDHDFELYNSSCPPVFSFQSFYGSTGDGNICNPNNIADFKTKVLFQTNQKGVHFMTSDGGFSVEGNESQQEILSKNIYLCQCLVALEIVRSHGHFLTKMFDVFTRFSVGLIYLMYKCFKKVAIFKPNASRPANGERYLICCDLQKNKQVESICKYLRFISEKLWEFNNMEENDILELIPMEQIKNDSKFYDYILNSNNKIGKRQIAALKKLKYIICGNSSGEEKNLRESQSEYRIECLKYWRLPDRSKIYLSFENKEQSDLMKKYLPEREWLMALPQVIKDKENLEKIYSCKEDWSFCAMYSSQKGNKCNIYVGLGSKTSKWRKDKNDWAEVKNLKLSSGTILYGEIVKETLKFDMMDEDSKGYRHCLHIIDALQLGDYCLIDLPFSERMDLITVYAESLNQEFQENRTRIRKKPIHHLDSLSLKSILHEDSDEKAFQHILPTLGFNSVMEFHTVNSVLFFKTQRLSEDILQQELFATRTQLFLDKSDIELFDILVEKLK